MNSFLFCFFVITVLFLILLSGCKRNDCYKEVLKLAPSYIELRSTYKMLRPKAIELHDAGHIDEETWNRLVELDKNLRKIDEKAKLFYNEAIDADSLSDEDVKLIIGVTRELVQAISLIVPKII